MKTYEPHFAPGDYFVMVSVRQLESWGMTQEAQTDMRLQNLAFARVNRINHAEFKPTELEELLGSANEDGVLVSMSRQGVNKAIKRLVNAGVFLEGSNVRCIQVPSYVVQRDGKGSTDTCHFCGINTNTRRIRKKEDGFVAVTPKRATEIRKTASDHTEQPESDSKGLESLPLPDPTPSGSEPLGSVSESSSEVKEEVPEKTYDPWDEPLPQRFLAPRQPVQEEPEELEVPEKPERLADRYKNMPDDRPQYEKHVSLFNYF